MGSMAQETWSMDVKTQNEKEAKQAVWNRAKNGYETHVDTDREFDGYGKLTNVYTVWYRERKAVA